MERARIGVVGCGFIGQHHIRFASEADHIELAAIADLRKEVAHETAEKYAVGSVHLDAESLITDPNVDGVVLAMPANVRCDLGVQVFEAGKHLLTEKPVARNLAEVDRLLAAQGDRIGAVCSSRFQNTGCAKAAAEAIASGRLGTIREIYCRAIGSVNPKREGWEPPIWRVSRSLNGGGILSNWGVYDLDYLMMITGWTARPQRVLARCWSITDHLAEGRVHPESDAECHVSAMIHCQGDLVIHYERSESAALAPESSWQVIGTHGSLRLNLLGGEGSEVILDTADAEAGLSSETIYQESENPHEAIHGGPVSDFGHAILEGRDPATSLKQARVIQAIIDGIYDSSDHDRCAEIGL